MRKHETSILLRARKVVESGFQQLLDWPKAPSAAVNAAEEPSAQFVGDIAIQTHLLSQALQVALSHHQVNRVWSFVLGACLGWPWSESCRLLREGIVVFAFHAGKLAL